MTNNMEISMVSIENDVATIAHIGDSRCYV